MNKTFINVDEPIAIAMGLISNRSSLDKALARQWAYMGTRDIGCSMHWLEDCVLYPSSNLSMRKPDDMWKAKDIALYTSDNKELQFAYRGLGNRIHASGHLALDGGEYAPSLHAPVDLSEDSHFFHLGSNGSSVFCAKVKYWKLPVDAYGQPMIPEYQALAIALFIRWMWTFANAGEEDRKLSRVEYLQARSEARALGKMPSGIEMDQVAKEWNNMMQAPQFKNF